MATLKRYPVAVFISITFVLSVVVSFAPLGNLSDAEKFLILGALIVPLPTIVALALSAVTGGVRPFLHQTLNWHVDWRWALIALGLAAGARLLVSVMALLTGAITAIEVSAFAPPFIVVIYLFALLEEIGWRGFAVRRSVTHRTAFAALLITGIPWSIIHIFFYLAQSADSATLLQVFVLNFALTVMVTWVYLRGGFNIWAAVILHGSQSLFSILNTNLPADLITPYSVLVYSLIALVILAVDRRRWFARPAETEAGEAVSQAQNARPRRGRRILRATGRGLKWVVIVLIGLAALGVIYQLIATEADRRAYSPPGQLYTVDGHQMHMICTGEGSPTVILEAGGGHFSATWARVQRMVAQSTRVCAYDRAGYGWSEPGPEPRDAQRVATELHTLLDVAGVEPSYVLAGHSLGGIYARVFNAEYPGEVIGMALIDATHPDSWARQGESIQALQAVASASTVLARVGLMRLFFAGQNFDLPEPDTAVLKADIASAQYWDTQRADAAAMEATTAEGRAAGELGDLPLASK